jgi:Immunity protein Imm1
LKLIKRLRLTSGEIDSAPMNMKAQFFDRQDAKNPLNGKTLSEPVAIRNIIQSVRQRAPFIAELIGDNGRELMLGLGSADGFVQFSSSDGSPPYLMALGHTPEDEGEQDFLIQNTVTPIPRRYYLLMQKVEEIAAVFLHSGHRAPNVVWEEI